MADPRFFQNKGPFSLEEVAATAGVALPEGADPAFPVTDIAAIGEAGPSELCFVENRRYVPMLSESRAGVVLLPKNLVDRAPEGPVLLVSDRPRRAFAKLAQRFYPEPVPTSGIHSSAVVDPSAEIGDGVVIDANAVVGPKASIGARCRIAAGAVIGEAVVIGEDTRIGEGASISHALIGARCFIYPGARVGQPGFGFEFDEAGPIKMPQLGRVLIEDDVEIGANSTIDRGSGPDTVVGRGTMIDNLVQLGHNVRVGRGCIIVAQVGIAGSTKVGDHVVIGGQVGVGGHLTIGDGVQIAATAGVTRSLEAGLKVGGAPAVPIDEFRRQIAAIKALGRRPKKTE